MLGIFLSFLVVFPRCHFEGTISSCFAFKGGPDRTRVFLFIERDKEFRHFRLTAINRRLPLYTAFVPKNSILCRVWCG